MGDREEITLEQFHARLLEQGMPTEHLAFRCPKCGTVQSVADLILAGAGEDVAAVEKYIGFSCVGRWSRAKGCDWTLGGLFQIHKLTVVTPDGMRHPSFEIATADEAKALRDSVPAST